MIGGDFFKTGYVEGVCVALKCYSYVDQSGSFDGSVEVGDVWMNIRNTGVPDVTIPENFLLWGQKGSVALLGPEKVFNSLSR